MGSTIKGRTSRLVDMNMIREFAELGGFNVVGDDEFAEPPVGEGAAGAGDDPPEGAGTEGFC